MTRYESFKATQKNSVLWFCRCTHQPFLWLTGSSSLQDNVNEVLDIEELDVAAAPKSIDWTTRHGHSDQEPGPVWLVLGLLHLVPPKAYTHQYQ